MTLFVVPFCSRRLLPCVVGAVLATLTLVAAPAPQPRELIVRYRAGALASQVALARKDARLQLNQRLKTRVMARAGHSGLDIVESTLPTGAALSILRKNPAVEYAEPNLLLHPVATSDDPSFTSGNLWGMYGESSTPANAFGSQAAAAWAAGHTGSSSVFVAVLDDGVQITHPDLAPNIWTNPFDPADGLDNDDNGYIDDVHGWNFLSETNEVFETGNGHGTHVAGTIGARGGNGLGVAGVNWNVTIIPLKFISGTSGSTVDAIEAIDYCIDLKNRHGVNLVAINASWGGAGYSAALHEAVLRAAKAGILFIAAAGNDGANNDTTPFIPSSFDTTVGTLSEEPASYNSIISVAAITTAGDLASFSNFGATRVHIGAPGQSIYSTYPVDLIQSASGTSMATPHVTGAAALYASTHPTATPAQIRAALLGAAIPTPSLAGKTTTGGRLNLKTIIAPAPVIESAGTAIVSETIANGVIDAGETVTVSVTLTNSAPFPTENLTTTLEASGGVLNPSGSQSFGTLAAGSAAVSRDFTFVVDATCGHDLTLSLALHDGSTNLGTATFILRVGAETNAFLEHFDSLLVPALPSGWSATLSGAGAPWQSAAGLADSGNIAVYAPNTTSASDNRLTSPSIHINSASAVLSFRHRFDFEPDWDGAVLEMSVGGSSFADVLSAGGTFLENGYNAVLNELTTPLPLRAVWSGKSSGFLTTRVQLSPALKGQDIRFRWRCGSDTAFGGTGWYVDSIQLIDGYTCALPAQSINEDDAAGPIPFSLGSASTEAGLQLSATSSNPSLIPSENAVLNGSGAARTLSITPATNEFGSATVTVKIDSDSATSYRTVDVSVAAVNDSPHFVAGPPITIPQDSGSQNLPNWATQISPGAANEAGQTLTFGVSVGNSTLFAVQPAIDSTGTLSFTPTLHRRGVSLLTIDLSDGENASSSQTVLVTVGENTDSDGDGLPDDFEEAHSLNPDDAGDGSLDADGDGASSKSEFLAGTDPGDPRSVFRISDQQIGFSPSAFSVATSLGHTYSIEENRDFPTGAWLPVSGAQSGTGTTMAVTELPLDATPARVIYRAKTLGETGEPVYSDLVGFCRFHLLGNSDTFVSNPFFRPASEFGAVISVNDNVVQVRGAPNWMPDQWVYAAGSQSNTYFMHIRSGALSGEFYPIIASGTDSLTLDLQGSSILALQTGDAIAIVPYWTLGTIFRGGEGVHESQFVVNRPTQVLFPNISLGGINLSAASIYYFYKGAWRRVGRPSTEIWNDEVVPPDFCFIVRHGVATNTTVTMEGSVFSGRFRADIRRNASGKQDNYLAVPRPLSFTLAQSGLVESGAFRSSAFTVNRVDELLVFDNNLVAKNKSVSAIYYYYNNGWRKLNRPSSEDHGSALIFQPGNAFIIRSGAGSSTSWNNDIAND